MKTQIKPDAAPGLPDQSTPAVRAAIRIRQELDAGNFNGHIFRIENWPHKQVAEIIEAQHRPLIESNAKR